MAENTNWAITSDGPKLLNESINHIDLDSIIAKFHGEQKIAVEFMVNNMRDSGISDEVIYDLIKKGYLNCDEVGYFIYYPKLFTDEVTLTPLSSFQLSFKSL